MIISEYTLRLRLGLRQIAFDRQLRIFAERYVKFILGEVIEN